MGSTACFLKPVEDSLLDQLLEAPSSFLILREAEFLAYLRDSHFDPGLDREHFTVSFVAQLGASNYFFLFYLPTGHKNDQDDATSHVFVARKIHPEMPRNGHVQINPCCVW